MWCGGGHRRRNDSRRDARHNTLLDDHTYLFNMYGCGSVDGGFLRQVDGAPEECVVRIRYVGIGVIHDCGNPEKSRFWTAILGGHHHGLYYG